MSHPLLTNKSGLLYLNFAKKRLALPTFKALNIYSDHAYLLDLVYINYFDLKPFTVGQLMAMKEIGSPATVHRKLNHLRNIHAIENFCIGQNNRTKYLRPTKETIISCDALMQTSDI